MIATKICDMCGSEFRASHNAAKYCSDACRENFSKNGRWLEGNYYRANGVCPICRQKHDNGTYYCKDCGRRRYLAIPERIRKDRRLRHKYNISINDYDTMLSQQNGACAICGIITDDLCVDHGHGTGEIRGLLCQNCNSGLGFFKDKVSNLVEAIKYLI